MSLRTENISLNCKKAYFQTIIENLHVGDVKSTQLVFTLTDGIKEIELPAGKTTAIIHGKKPDGTEIHNDCAVENNKIYYTLTAQDTAVSGIVDYMLDVTVNRDEQYERAYRTKFTSLLTENLKPSPIIGKQSTRIITARKVTPIFRLSTMYVQRSRPGRSMFL